MACDLVKWCQGRERTLLHGPSTRVVGMSFQTCSGPCDSERPPAVASALDAGAPVLEREQLPKLGGYEAAAMDARNRNRPTSVTIPESAGRTITTE